MFCLRSVYFCCFVALTTASYNHLCLLIDNIASATCKQCIPIKLCLVLMIYVTNCVFKCHMLKTLVYNLWLLFNHLRNMKWNNNKIITIVDSVFASVPTFTNFPFLSELFGYYHFLTFAFLQCWDWSQGLVHVI